MTDSALTYITIFLTSILGLFLAFVSFSFAKLIRKYYKLKEEKENLEKNYQAEAEKIVAAARDKAQQIVREATSVSEETKKEITTELQKASQSQISDFKNLQDEIRNQILGVFNTATSQFEGVAKAEIEKFQANLQSQTASSQGFMQKAIDEALVGVQKEIDEYKSARLKDAQESIVEIVKLATKKFLGDIIRPEDHEKLVIASLKEAEKQSLFVNISNEKKSTVVAKNDNNVVKEA